MSKAACSAVILSDATEEMTEYRKRKSSIWTKVVKKPNYFLEHHISFSVFVNFS
jgi:hypothetical protein